MTTGETVIARYDITKAILGLAALLIGYPAFVFGFPLLDHDSYVAFMEASRRGYSWLGLMALAPIVVGLGLSLLVDMIRMRGRAIVASDGVLVFSGPWRLRVPAADIERVETSGKPYGIKVHWRPGKSRAVGAILFASRPAEIRDAILALLPKQPGLDEAAP